jgi:hypothetical protein
MDDYWSAEYKAAIVEDLNEAQKCVEYLKRLLLDLTPGGYEFAGDPGACAAWVRARLASVGKLAAERNKLREQAEQMAKLLAEAQTAINLLDDDWIRQHPELGCPDPDELLEKIGRVLRDGRPSNA